MRAIEPLEFLVSRRIGRSAYERRPRIELAPQGAGIAILAKLEVTAIGTVDARARTRLYAPLDLDDCDAIRTDAHPIGGAGQETPFEHRPDEGRLLKVPDDPETVRHDADHFLAKLDRGGPKEFRLPPPARLIR